MPGPTCVNSQQKDLARRNIYRKNFIWPCNHEHITSRVRLLHGCERLVTLFLTWVRVFLTLTRVFLTWVKVLLTWVRVFLTWVRLLLTWVEVFLT